MPVIRPSITWLWAVIAMFVIGYSLFSNDYGAPLQSDWTTVEKMIRNGEVESIVVENRETAIVRLKKEAVERYRSDKESELSRMPANGPQLTFEIGSVDSFRNDLDKAVGESGHEVPSSTTITATVGSTSL